MDQLFYDLRLGLRSLLRSPWLLASAALCLALGIGFNLTMLEFLDLLLFRPPDYVRESGAVQRLSYRVPEIDARQVMFSYPDYMDLVRGNRGFAGLSAYARTKGSLGGGPGAQPVRLELVTSSFFPLLGVKPVRGRLWSFNDDHPERLAFAALVISEFYRRFSGGTESLGKTLHIGQQDYSIIGVLPPRFTGVDLDPVDMRSISLTPVQSGWSPDGTKAAHLASWCVGASAAVFLTACVNVAGLLMVPLEQAPATATSRALFVRTVDPHRVSNLVRDAVQSLGRNVPFVEVRTLGVVLNPQLRDWRTGMTVFSLFGLLALVVAVLGIFATVGHAVASRAAEMGVRKALGARFQDLLWTIMKTGMGPAAAGVALGLGAALALGRFIGPFLCQVAPRDPLVIATAAFVLLSAALLASFLPALRVKTVDPVAALRAE